MPVPEPPGEGGLWASVRSVTGWPETDEDRLTQLAQDWRTGAQRFTAGGAVDLSSLGGAWPDSAGEAADARLQGTLVNVMGTGDGMTMLADRVDAFAGSVRGCKIDIGRIVERNIPGYVTARDLPRGLAESDATIIRTSVIEQVNERIGGCVREIEGLGLYPGDLPGRQIPRGTMGGLLDGGTDSTTVVDPVPPWLQTGGGPLVGLPPGLGPRGGITDYHADAADGEAGIGAEDAPPPPEKVPGAILGNPGDVGGWLPTEVPPESEPVLGPLERDGVEGSGSGPDLVGPNGGEGFDNDGRNGGYRLPQVDSEGNPIQYRESGTIPAADNPRPGGERFVTGTDGSIYYTPTHYQTWIVVRPGR
jgi:hypothetical protein